MGDKKAKPFRKDAYYPVDSNRLRDRMNRYEDDDALLDMELSCLHMKRICGVGNTKDDMDESDQFEENYLTYLRDLENSVILKPVVENEPDPDYVMFLECLEKHGNSYKLDAPVEHAVPIEEDVDDPQYLMFLQNLKVHENSYVVHVPLKHCVPLCIKYEAENVHFDDVMNRKISKHEERYNAKKTNRRLGVINTTYIKRNHGKSTKKKFVCSGDEYLHGERNIAEKNDRRNVSSYWVRSTPRKRTCGDSRRENSHFTSHVHVQEKRNNFLKNNRKNVIIELSGTEEGSQSENMKGKNSCSLSDSYGQAESKIARKNNRRNVKSYGVSDTPKKKTRGESIERKFSHYTSHVNVQEKRNTALKNNKRKVGSYGVNSAKKARTCGKDTKRNNSCSSTSGCYVQDVVILDSSEAKDSYFNKRVVEPCDENVQEKRTVGEVIKMRKLMSHTGDHIQEGRNLNVSNGKKSGVEGSGTSKKITKLHSSNHFQEKQMTKKNNPISVSFADLKDKERTGQKNSIPLKIDHLKKDQCVNVLGNSRSAPKKSTFQKSVINDVYDLFLKNLKVIEESVAYKSGDNERVLYELSCERRLKIVADSSNPPIKSHRPIKNNVRTSIAAESRDQSTCKKAAGLSLAVQVATEKQPTHPATSAIPASRSTRDQSTCKNAAGLSLAVQVATEKQPTHPSTSAIPASRWTNPLLDKQLSKSSPHRVGSIMRKRLLVIISRPYDKQEHEQIWKELSCRSAIRTHRDSRSGGSHRPGQMGRSLLDWHPELNSEIDKVKSEPLKVLNLLRMLNFYIKKLACGNICKPWLDDSLMTILHGLSA